MPPHCNTLDGPVVKAAEVALKARNVNLVLPWVPKKAESKIKKAFNKTLKVRKLGKAHLTHGKTQKREVEASITT